MAAIPSDAQGAERARREALEDPIAVRNIISADGNAIAIGISIREQAEGVSERQVHETLERVLAPARAQFATLAQVGPPRIDAEIREGLMHDLRVLVPASALLLALTVFGFYRSVFAAAMPLVVASISLLWTFGMMGWMGIPVSILTAMLPSLVVVIGATEIMRMISGYYAGLQQAKTEGVSGRARATEFMLRSLGAPAVLTVLTTALGFASNSVAGIAIIRDFGQATAFAILSNGLITVLLVPMLYGAFGPGSGRLPAFASSGGFGVMAGRAFGVMRQRMSLAILALAGVLCILFVQQASSLYVTNEPLTFFRPERPLVQDAQRMQQDLAGIKIFYIALQSNTEGAFRDPANLQRLADIQAFIAKQKIFDRSLSLADIVAQANQQAGGGRPEAYRVPPTRTLVAQYLLLHPQRDLEPYVSHDYRRANIVVRHNVRDSSTLNHHILELREVVGHYAGPDMVTAVVGENLMVNAAADRLLEGQALALAGLLAVVFIVMSLMFTSVKGGFIALVPSVVPILMILGVMRILEIPLNAGTVMVAVIAIGIAIDGTIHLFSRYSELCRSTSNYDEAVIETVKDEAAPVIAVSLALALGFGVLLLSDFTLIAQFGALAAATMLFSIFANLLVTPLVMSRIRLVGLYEILAMSKQRAALEHSALFQGMTDYQIRKTILISELREYPDGERLIEQGTIGSSMYLVVSGQLEVIRREGATGGTSPRSGRATSLAKSDSCTPRSARPTCARAARCRYCASTTSASRRISFSSPTSWQSSTSTSAASSARGSRKWWRRGRRRPRKVDGYGNRNGCIANIQASLVIEKLNFNAAYALHDPRIARNGVASAGGSVAGRRRHLPHGRGLVSGAIVRGGGDRAASGFPRLRRRGSRTVRFQVPAGRDSGHPAVRSRRLRAGPVCPASCLPCVYGRSIRPRHRKGHRPSRSRPSLAPRVPAPPARRAAVRRRAAARGSG